MHLNPTKKARTRYDRMPPRTEALRSALVRTLASVVTVRKRLLEKRPVVVPSEVQDKVGISSKVTRRTIIATEQRSVIFLGKSKLSKSRTTGVQDS